MFFFAKLWDNVAFLQQTYIKKKKKKEGKRSEMPARPTWRKETTMLVSRRIDRGTAHE